MKYNELTINKNKTKLRVGRGIAAGRGKTAGRGTKGQGARKSPTRQGFAGGQTPLYMQLPKLRGFKSKRRPTINVYTDQLDSIKKSTIDTLALAEAGVILDPNVKVKLIARGELKAKKDVKLQAASAGAITIIEKVGGSFTPVAILPRPTKKSKIDK